MVGYEVTLEELAAHLQQQVAEVAISNYQISKVEVNKGSFDNCKIPET